MAPKKTKDIRDTQTAVETLRAALNSAGIVFPSLRADPASPALGLVELGRVGADVAVHLARALEKEPPE
ncbi:MULTISPECIES: hypothetical protein [unclassified Streptomyces]|jgi:hypothetical protein|uniref:hypothetical protein n=1 Tax=unclassified Streptomyces TaxID=2593676 RepID=UPI00332A35D0